MKSGLRPGRRVRRVGLVTRYSSAAAIALSRKLERQLGRRGITVIHDVESSRAPRRLAAPRRSLFLWWISSCIALVRRTRPLGARHPRPGVVLLPPHCCLQARAERVEPLQRGRLYRASGSRPRFRCRRSSARSASPRATGGRLGPPTGTSNAESQRRPQSETSTCGHRKHPETDASLIAAAAGGVWVVGSNSIATRVDPQTDKVVATIPVARDPTGIAIGAGSLWVSGRNSYTITRISATSSKITAKISTPEPARYVAVGAGAVWAVSNETPVLWRINTAQTRCLARSTLNRQPD